MLGASHDTDNETEYALTCNVIRDFCEDAIASGRLPSDCEIHAAVYPYVIERDESDHKPLMIGAKEAAVLADVSKRTITRMCEDGHLPAVKLRGTWRINRASFMKLLEGSE